MYYQTYTADEYEPLTFPVELSEDGNTLTIKALTDQNGGKWYPTLIGMDNTSLSGFAPGSVYTVSEIVLTRGWDGTRSASKMAKMPNGRFNKPAGDMPEFGYKSLTRFAAPVEKEDDCDYRRDGRAEP